MLMYPNDSTYRGINENSKMSFNSPIAPMNEGEDEYSRRWVRFSKETKAKLIKHFKAVNEKLGLSLPHPDDLTDYENDDYLWLMVETEGILRRNNLAMRHPITHKLLPERKEIPYVQVRLVSTAFSKTTRYPKVSVDSETYQDKLHYIIEFQKPFLDAFMNFIFSFFDDNPQEYVEMNGYKQVVYQYRAPIYRMAPFDKYFDTRHDLPGPIFSKAVQMLLAHEIAHVGNGHLDLQHKNPLYGKQPNTLIVEEDDADAQAICWMLGEHFLNANGNVLPLSKSELFFELSLTVFTIYMLYTWDYSAEERRWSNETMQQYLRKPHIHLPYQLRAYNMIMVCYNRLSNLGIWCERDGMVSISGEPIKRDFMQDVFKESLDMIKAFEISYHMLFNHTADVCELFLKEEWKDEWERMRKAENASIPELDREDIPWLLGYEPEAQVELKRVHDLWKDVRIHLEENGTYCKLREFEPWVDLSRG